MALGIHPTSAATKRMSLFAKLPHSGHSGPLTRGSAIAVAIRVAMVKSATAALVTVSSHLYWPSAVSPAQTASRIAVIGTGERLSPVRLRKTPAVTTATAAWTVSMVPRVTSR